MERKYTGIYLRQQRSENKDSSRNSFDISSYQARYYLTQLCQQKKLKTSHLSRRAATYWRLSGHET
ncbi:hypothetical protein C3N85_05365 [Salmonella enterica subsp. enterica serovar Morehead]|nr:hypothetical protein [Salmonella enterica subsp. enterica serovar Java]EEM2536260.1 hypothetical protein [Salmonella enterica subsp. enterica serovar Morehead]